MNAQYISGHEIINCQWKGEFCESRLFGQSNLMQLSSDIGAGSFYFSCTLNCLTDKDNRTIDVYVMKTCFKSAMATIKIRISQMDYHVRNVNNWTTQCKFSNLPIKYQYQVCSEKICPHHYSLYANNSHDRKEHDLEINCQIIWYGFVEKFYSPNSVISFIPYSENMKYCDIKIKVGDNYYPAHKVIITSQSSVLDKTLEVKMKESLENCIDLTDLGGDVVEELLLFLYENRIDKAEKNEELLVKLFKVGDMYDILALKNCCGMLLSNRLNEENVLMLLENSYIHKSLILGARAIAYIVVERDKIFLRSDFKIFGLRQPELLFEICSMFKFLLDS